MDPRGALLYTDRDVERGQEVFLNNGLMEYGSVFGHGAYLGPDYTADYLRRASDFVRRGHGGRRSDRAVQQTIDDFRTNRYDKRTKTLRLTAAQAEAHRRLVRYYSRFFSEPTSKNGLRPDAITDREKLADLTAFFGWTAWAGAAERPGHNYSYTNNWPPEPRVDNTPTANVVVWSVLSLIALLGGIGILFAVFGRWRLGWQGREQAPRPSPRELSPDLPREFDEVVHRAMAQEPSERYPSAGDLGEAALVAAGGLRKASPWSVVATGEAAPPAPGAEPPEAVRAASAVPYGVEPPSSPHEPASNGHADAGGIGRPDTLRWAIALGFLAIVFVGMIAALGAISSL